MKTSRMAAFSSAWRTGGGAGSIASGAVTSVWSGFGGWLMDSGSRMGGSGIAGGGGGASVVIAHQRSHFDQQDDGKQAQHFGQPVRGPQAVAPAVRLFRVVRGGQRDQGHGKAEEDDFEHQDQGHGRI